MPEDDRKYCVYRHTSPEGKVYIGITGRDPIKRWAHGRGYKLNKHFSRAITKYGWDSFTHEILFSGLTKNEACEKEIEMIVYHKSNNPKFGYNLSSGGESPTAGCHHSDKTKNAMSEKAKGRRFSDETRQKLREANLGRTVSEETRKKLSAYNRGKRMSDVAKRKMSASALRYRVVQLSLDGDIITVFSSTKLAAENIGCSRELITWACNGSSRTAKGYKWKYEII